MPKRKSKNGLFSETEESSDDDYGGPTQKTQRQKSKIQRRRTKLMTQKTANSSSDESETVTTMTVGASASKPKKMAAKVPRKSMGVGQPLLSRTSEPDNCGLEGCDFLGHLNGEEPSHATLVACPMYHNLTESQCEDLYLERRKLRLQRKAVNTRSPGREQQEFLSQLTEARKRKSTLKDKDKEEMAEFNKKYDRFREPLLDKIASPVDLQLFREAQALVCQRKEYERAQHHMLSETGEWKLKEIEMGPHLMDTWYESPYPDEYNRVPKLYICQFCLKYMKTATVAQRHAVKCPWQHPPGNEIYRKDKISFFEVDGREQRAYCQNLCLLAKLFLNYKTLYYKVEPFLFYVMTKQDATGCHMIGYFSKEKNCYLNYNVSCILTLPQYMRQGYGKMLIDFSYLLTKHEGKIGSPEKPLSDLGLISYRSYWKDVLLDSLAGLESSTEICIKDLSHETAINSNDIISTLQSMGMLKYWKGKHIILRKDDIFAEYVKKKSRREEDRSQRVIDPTALRWLAPKFDVNHKQEALGAAS